MYDSQRSRWKNAQISTVSGSGCIRVSRASLLLNNQLDISCAGTLASAAELRGLYVERALNQE